MHYKRFLMQKCIIEYFIIVIYCKVVYNRNILGNFYVMLIHEIRSSSRPPIIYLYCPLYLTLKAKCVFTVTRQRENQKWVSNVFLRVLCDIPRVIHRTRRLFIVFLQNFSCLFCIYKEGSEAFREPKKKKKIKQERNSYSS